MKDTVSTESVVRLFRDRVATKSATIFYKDIKHQPEGTTIQINQNYELSSIRIKKQLLQLCTARTAWSDSDQAVLAVQSCNSWWLGPLWSDSEIKLVSVLFGKCTTLVATKCWPMETRLPCGDQWKAEKLGVFRRWPICRCFIKSDRAG